MSWASWNFASIEGIRRKCNQRWICQNLHLIKIIKWFKVYTFFRVTLSEKIIIIIKLGVTQSHPMYISERISSCVDFFINFITWKIQFLYLSCPPHLKFLINIVLNTSLNLYYLIWTILLIYLRLGRSYSVWFLSSSIWCFKKYIQQ